jgi:succinate dehydrogenase / fumarate reductase membrane anchor subunit
MKKGYKETSKTGAIGWFMQRISAVILFVLLILHFVTYHFMSEGAYTWRVVVEKMQSPWFNLIQFLFLITALYHGLNGVWIVVEDYIHAKGWRMFLYGLILTVGLSLFFVGMLTIFNVSSFSQEIISSGVVR